MATGQSVFGVRYAMQRHSGETVYLSVNAAPLFDEHNQLNGVITTADDITEQALTEKRQVEQVAEELKALELLSPLPQTAITSQLYASQALQQRQPQTFRELVQTYQSLLDTAIENHMYRVQNNLSEELRNLANQLGRLNAGPRDLVDIHTTALKNHNQKSPPAKMQVYAVEGRFTILETMGYLTAFYRNRLTAARSLILSETTHQDSSPAKK